MPIGSNLLYYLERFNILRFLISRSHVLGIYPKFWFATVLLKGHTYVMKPIKYFKFEYTDKSLHKSYIYMWTIIRNNRFFFICILVFLPEIHLILKCCIQRCPSYILTLNLNFQIKG